MPQQDLTLRKTTHKIARRIKKFLKGKTTVRLSHFVYKFVLNPARIPTLQREYRYSKSANSSPIFSESVVEAQSIAPALIRYPVVCTNRSLFEKIDAMIAFCRRNEVYLQSCPRQPACETLKNYCSALEVNWNSYLTESGVEHGRLSFDLPVSFMHGDFGPGNTGFRDACLVMFDWEFAYEHGSLLYDWWYMNHICRFMNYPSEAIEKTSAFLQEGLERFGVEPDVFDYFCNAVDRLQRCKK